MIRRLFPLVLLAVALDASAREHAVQQFTDKGTTLAKDPYHNDSALSTGRLEGFRKVYVDEAAAGALKAAKPAPSGAPAMGDLAIANPTSAWADLTVNGQLVGRAGPFRTVVIHDVGAGVYQVGYALPNGRTWTDEVATEAPVTAPAAPAT